MATTISLDTGNNNFFIFDGFLGGASAASASNIKGATIDGLAGKDTVDTTKQGYAFPDSHFKLTVDGTGVITLTTSSGSATFRNFEQIKYTNLVIAVGTTGDDALTGSTSTSVPDLLLGLAGNDTLDGSAGADSMYGGAGNDTYVVDNAADQVIESNSSVHFDTATRTATTVDAGGIDTVQSAVNFTLGAFLENLTLTGTAANGTGNTLNNAITGNASANLLSGDAGNDTLDGGLGNDTLAGGAGNDTYIVDSALDVVQEATVAGGSVDAGGNDTVQASVDYTLGAFLENLTLTGTALSGTGNALANQITGNDGANTLDGGAGNDSMLGGAGNDTYIVDSSLDVVQEFTVSGGSVDAGGTDTVLATASFTLGTFIENLTLGGSAALIGTGNASANLMTGNDGANKFFGLDGSDTLIGGAGNDTLDGGLLTDTMRGGAGNDTYVVNSRFDVVDETTDGVTDAGGVDMVRSLAPVYTLANFVENLVLGGTGNIGGTGNDKANLITGNNGSNAINGGLGADIIKAGLGNDILTGGAGIDSFVFNTALDATTNVDIIKDWDANGAADRIQLDDDIFLALGPVTVTTALDATMFVKGTAALDANDHIIYDQTSGALYYDADGVGGAAQVQFATIFSNATTHPGAGLTAGDFLVVI